MLKNFKRIKEAGEAFSVRDFFTREVLAGHFNDEEIGDVKAFMSQFPQAIRVYRLEPKAGKQLFMSVNDGHDIYAISVEFIVGYERQGWIGHVEVDGNPFDGYLSTALFRLLD